MLEPFRELAMACEENSLGEGFRWLWARLRQQLEHPE
jgi:hypothetical protein